MSLRKQITLALHFVLMFVHVHFQFQTKLFFASLLQLMVCVYLDLLVKQRAGFQQTPFKGLRRMKN